MTFPSIPTPTNDVNALFRTVQVLKQAMEQVIGLRGVQHMPCMYVQETAPTGANDGDFWLNTIGKTTKLYVQATGAWVVAGTLT